MRAEVEILEAFVHGPIEYQRGQREVFFDEPTARKLEAKRLVRIVDAPRPQRLVRITSPGMQAAGVLPTGKPMPAGEAPSSSSSQAGRASQKTTSSASAPGGKRKGRPPARGA